MGLCPDCRSERETVTFIGESKDDVLNKTDDTVEEDRKTDQVETEDGADLEICNLCGSEYEVNER